MASETTNNGEGKKMRIPGAPQLDFKALLWIAGVSFVANLAGWWTVTSLQIQPVRQRVEIVETSAKERDIVLGNRITAVNDRVDLNKDLAYAIRETMATMSTDITWIKQRMLAREDGK